MIYLVLETYCPRKFESSFSMEKLSTIGSANPQHWFCFLIFCFCSADLCRLWRFLSCPLFDDHVLYFFSFFFFFFVFATLLSTRMTALVVKDIKELLTGIFSSSISALLRSIKSKLFFYLRILLLYKNSKQNFSTIYSQVFVSYWTESKVVTKLLP